MLTKHIFRKETFIIITLFKKAIQHMGRVAEVITARVVSFFSQLALIYSNLDLAKTNASSQSVNPSLL